MQVAASESAMVGDSLTHDVAGARRVGMRGILLARGGVKTAGRSGRDSDPIVDGID